MTEFDDTAAFDALAAASGNMATHFAMAAAVTYWLKEQEVAKASLNQSAS